MATCPDCKGTKVYVGLNWTEPCQGCLGTGEMLPQSHAVGMDRAEGDGGPSFMDLYHGGVAFKPRYDPVPSSVGPFDSFDNLPPGEYKLRWNPRTQKYDVNPPGIEMNDQQIVVAPGPRRRYGWVQHPASPLEIITNKVNEQLRLGGIDPVVLDRITEICRGHWFMPWHNREPVSYSSHESRPT